SNAGQSQDETRRTMTASLAADATPQPLGRVVYDGEPRRMVPWSRRVPATATILPSSPGVSVPERAACLQGWHRRVVPRRSGPGGLVRAWRPEYRRRGQRPGPRATWTQLQERDSR